MHSVLTGLTQQRGKSEFIEFPVIASQFANWRGNPPDEWNQVTISTKKTVFPRPVGQLSIHFSSNRGIATPACALVRNDSVS